MGKNKKLILCPNDSTERTKNRDGPICIDERPFFGKSRGNGHGDIPKRLILRTSCDPGFYFGGLGQHQKDLYVGMRQGTEGNILVVGGNGSGKSAGIAMPTTKTWCGALCVTDVKGELSEYYQELYQFGFVTRPYIIFDPMDTEGPSYDPFWWLLMDGPDNLFSNILEIALAIMPIMPEDKQPFWVETERGVFAAALLYYFGLGLSFSEAMCLIVKQPTSTLCEELAQSDDVRVLILIGEAASLKEDLLASIDRGLRNKLAIFAADIHISHAFRGKREGAISFTWDDLTNYNIFLRVPADKIEQWGGAINLMYTQLIRHLERRPEQHSLAGKDNIQTLLLMDEFARFGKLEMITSAMATLRSKNVNICLMIQSIAQLDKIYGECDRRIIFDNCQFQAILRANDADTQKYLSELTGTCIRRQHGVGRQLDMSMNTRGYHQEISEVREPHIFPHELSTLDDVLLLTPYGSCRVEKSRPKSVREMLTVSTTERRDIKLPSIMDDVPEYWFYKPPQNEEAKMLSIQERADNAANHINKIGLQKRLEQKRQREEKAKMDKRRNYIVGELVTRYFPKLSTIEPGTPDENKIRFAPLEAFLIELVSKEKLVKEITEKAQHWNLETGVYGPDV